MLPARKTVSKRTLHEEHSSKTFEVRLMLVIYIMNYVYMVKKIHWKLWNVMKNGRIENETFHSTSKNQNFKRVIFIMKVLP